MEEHMKLHGDGKRVKVKAGKGCFLPKGTRVKWIWNGPCKYVPICLPAFTPDNCGREEEHGNHLAKTSDAMDKLRALHKDSKQNQAAVPPKEVLLGFCAGALAGAALAAFTLGRN